MANLIFSAIPKETVTWKTGDVFTWNGGLYVATDTNMGDRMMSAVVVSPSSTIKGAATAGTTAVFFNKNNPEIRKVKTLKVASYE